MSWSLAIPSDWSFSELTDVVVRVEEKTSTVNIGEPFLEVRNWQRKLNGDPTLWNKLGEERFVGRPFRYVIPTDLVQRRELGPGTYIEVVWSLGGGFKHVLEFSLPSWI